MSETPGTPKNWHKLLDTLRAGGSVKAACSSQRIGRTTYYRRLKSDPEFRTLAEEAIEEGTDELEDVAVTRAKESSDTLLIFLLKARRPDKYREKWQGELTGPGGAPLVITIADRPDGPS